MNYKEDLKSIGFNSIGLGWFENKDHQIRIRKWKGNEIDFWFYISEDDNQLRFRGEIYNLKEIIWVLDRCFKVKL